MNPTLFARRLLTASLVITALTVVIICVAMLSGAALDGHDVAGIYTRVALYGFPGAAIMATRIHPRRSW